jgi:hypothetical protein
MVALAAPAVAQSVPLASSAAASIEDPQRLHFADRLGRLASEGRTVLPEARPVTVNRSLARSSSPARRRYTPPRLDLVTMPAIPSSDLECLTQAIYYEARNESEEGQAAVAEVVMNRSRALGYPPRVCDVVYQRNSRTCQFTFTCDGSLNRGVVNAEAWARAERIAREVYEGRRPAVLPGRSLNYHADYVRPSWSARLERVRQIGTHIFYGSSTSGGATPGAAETQQQGRSGGLVFTRNSALDEAYARAMQQPGG